MRRKALLLLLIAAATFAPACFGDNDGGAALQISAPDELDGGEVVDVTITVRGKANEQFAVAVDSTAGTFAPQSKVVITGDDGEGSFVTRYTVDNKATIAELTANASSVRLSGESVTKRIPVHEVERVGNIAPITRVVAEMEDYLVASPLTITTAGTLRKLAIVAPAPARAHLGLYTSASTVGGEAPQVALTRTTASLVVGANELEVPAQPLAAGTYWLLITYESTPGNPAMVARSLSITDGWTLTGYKFSDGLPETAPAMTASANLGGRNLYVVLRK